jgi:hypothetical protein
MRCTPPNCTGFICDSRRRSRWILLEYFAPWKVPFLLGVVVHAFNSSYFGGRILSRRILSSRPAWAKLAQESKHKHRGWGWGSACLACLWLWVWSQSTHKKTPFLSFLIKYDCAISLPTRKSPLVKSLCLNYFNRFYKGLCQRRFDRLCHELG